MASLRRSVAFIALVCALAMIGSTMAAAGDQPLTQLALMDFEWEYNISALIANTQFTGAAVNSNGILFATMNDAVLRIPMTVTTSTAKSVESYRVTNANPVNQFLPCDTSPGTPADATYGCGVGTLYAGTSATLYYKTNDYGTGLRLPFIIGTKLYAISTLPSTGSVDPSLVIFDTNSFSVSDTSFNPIPSAALRGPVKVINDVAGSRVFIVAAGVNATTLINIPYGTIRQTDTWQTKSFPGVTAVDAALSTDRNTMVFLGAFGSDHVVWSTGLTTWVDEAPATTSLTGTACAAGGTAIAYDTDPNTNTVTVVVGCSGTAIVSLSSTFAVTNTSLLDSRDTFVTWAHEPASGIIYAGLLGAAGTNDFGNVLQYSISDNRREGRIENDVSLKASMIVLSPYPVPASATRAGAPFFWVVGGNLISKINAVARWEAAQACSGNCGASGSPVRGTCSRRTCTCNDYADPVSGDTLQYLQPWCASLSCPFNCNGLGSCSNGTCICQRTWTTTDPTKPCLTPRCPNDCLASTGHGACNNVSGTLTCNCFAGWGGDDCSQKAKFPCSMLTGNCTACVDNPACVWCASARTCVVGTVIGPTAPLSTFECRSWFHGECPSVGINIMNYIMTAVVGIITLISLISGALNDTTDEIPERRTEWYLFQRANKLWSMVYQLQLIAIAGLINFDYATNFSAFVRYWNWILLAWGFPWHHSESSKDAWYDSVSKTGRTTSSWEQYQTYWKSVDNNMFFTFLLWWGVALGFFVVFYAILLIISMIRGGRTGFLATTRPVFVLLRALEFGHLGVCVMGPLALVASKGASAIVGGILWVVLGLGAPIGLFIWLGFLKEKKDLFKPTFAASCYPFYGAFDFRYRAFIVAPWVRRILIGLFVGFIAKSNPLGQLIAIAIVHLLYLVFVIIQRNMFSDYLQRYLEIILAVLNLISFLFLFGFYGSPSGNLSSAMGIIFLVLQFLAVTVSAAFFIISWLQLNQVYSLSQCIKFCTCRGEK